MLLQGTAPIFIYQLTVLSYYTQIKLRTLTNQSHVTIIICTQIKLRTLTQQHLFIFGSIPFFEGPHEFMYPSKEDSAQNVVFKVTDTASSFDWIAISQEGSGCDYLVTIHTFTIDCLNPDGTKDI